MIWWHRWRIKKWLARYIEVLGELDIMDKSIAVDQLKYHDALCRRMEAQSALSYHRSKLPSETPF